MELTTQINATEEILLILSKYSFTKIEGVALLEVIKFNLLEAI